MRWYSPPGAPKEIAARYGGLSNPGDKLLKAEDFELALDEVVWLITLLGWREDEVWLMPLGSLLDQWEIYKRFSGMATPPGEHFIDDVIPAGL